MKHICQRCKLPWKDCKCTPWQIENFNGELDTPSFIREHKPAPHKQGDCLDCGKQWSQFFIDEVGPYCAKHFQMRWNGIPPTQETT